MWRYLIICLSLVACSTNSIKPKAAGTMYDVVVMTDDNDAETIVKGILESPVEGLPQSEPWFNVMTNGSATLTNATKYARNIVMVKIKSGANGITNVRYQRDVYAKGQMIVYISTPSIHRLRYDSARIANGLLSLLDQAELNGEKMRLVKSYDDNARKLIKSTIGCDILVPKDISSTMKGRDFVWLSNDANRAMQNICVYAYPGTKLNAERAIEMRDSILGANIKGEEKGMHMATEPNIKPTTAIDNGKLTMRGLWIMEGDAMGGPFVSLSIMDSARKRIVVAEGFVYAPESKKKILIKQLEAAISTLKLQHKQ